MAIDVSLIIVNHNHPEETGACVQSLARIDTDVTYEVIVVNTNPARAYTGREAEGSILNPNENRGFAAAVNLGVTSASGEFLLPMNADILFESDCLTPLLDRMRAEPLVGVLLPRLINPDGTDQYNARRFYTLLTVLCRRTPLGALFPSVSEHHLMRKESHAQPYPADWGMGAALLARRDLLQGGRLYDERFFLYFEDVDLCARCWQAGLRVEACPAAPLVHTHQRESQGLPWGGHARHHLVSLFRFWRKHGRLAPTPAAHREYSRSAA
ncbi:MAG: glycosyltransferase family 2 protein [Planctomycetota bacterium]